MPEETMIADVGPVESGGDVAVETPEIESGAPETAEQQTTETPEQQKETEETRPGRPPIDPIKNAFDKLKKADPKAAAELRKSYYTLQQKANEASELLELHGGEEGIANLKAEAEEFAQALSKVASGDPAILDDVLADSKDGFLKLAAASIDKMRSVDPAAYDRTLAPHLLETLERTGVAQTIGLIARFIQAGDGEGAIAQVAKAQEWLAQLDKFAKENKLASTSNDPRDQQIKSEREQLDKEKAEIYQKQINTSVTRSINGEISRHLTPLLNGKTLTQQQRQGIVSDAYKHIAEVIRAQERTQAQIAAFRKQGRSAEEIARFIGSKITAKDADGHSVASKAVKSAWDGRGFGATTARQTTPSASGPEIRNKPPDSSHIDWSKDRSRQRHMSGEATLLPKYGGKVVKWDWAKV